MTNVFLINHAQIRKLNEQENWAHFSFQLYLSLGNKQDCRVGILPIWCQSPRFVEVVPSLVSVPYCSGQDLVNSRDRDTCPTAPEVPQVDNTPKISSGSHAMQP